MRIAAGILLMVNGLFDLVTFAPVLAGSGGYGVGFNLFVIVSGILITAGGVLCILRRVWGLCLAASLVEFIITLIWLVGLQYLGAAAWQTWLMSVTGTLPVIFISIKRKDWKRRREVQA